MSRRRSRCPTVSGSLCDLLTPSSGKKISEGGFGSVHEFVTSDGFPLAFKVAKTNNDGANDERLEYFIGRYASLITEHALEPCAMCIFDQKSKQSQPYDVDLLLMDKQSRSKKTLILAYERLGNPIKPINMGEDPREMITALVLGLTQLHEGGIRHGDIKPANVLVRAGIPVYIDFGMSWVVMSEFTRKKEDYLFDISEDDFTDMMVMFITNEDFCKRRYTGTPPYTAPENIINGVRILDYKRIQRDIQFYSRLDGLGVEDLAKANDLWALGMLMLYLIIGERLDDRWTTYWDKGRWMDPKDKFPKHFVEDYFLPRWLDREYKWYVNIMYGLLEPTPRARLQKAHDLFFSELGISYDA